MLELHSPDGAFDRIEAYLRERGFFAPGGEDLVASVYLGYRLSEPLRRTSVPAPPEPCPLPLAAVAVADMRGPGPDTSRADDVSIGPWERTWSEGDYGDAVEAVRGAIGRGDVYQVNLVQHLSADFDGDPDALAGATRLLLTAYARRRRLGGRLRVARALPRPPRPAGLDGADQGNPSAR